MASTTGVATVECDATYAYVASNGLPTHTMMDGIVASNLQVPIAQNFFGANAWKIPLSTRHRRDHHHRERRPDRCGHQWRADLQPVQTRWLPER